MGNLSAINVFVQVVDRGSFTAAADKLELSKAAVSKYVAQLEKRLGTRLLHRTTRRLSLTEAGAALYNRVGNAVADIAAAEAEVIELTGSPRGRLRVAAPAYFGNVFLMPVVSRFMRDYPEIELELDLDNRIVDLVAERFDVGVRITTLMDSSMVARRLTEVRLVTVASPKYLHQAGTPTKPADLGDHLGLTYSLARSPNEWHFLGNDKRSLTVRIKGRLRCNSDEALKQAALDGIGITRFPQLFVANEIANGRLVRLLQDYEPPPASLCAVFPTRTNLPPKVRVFVDFLAQHLRPTQGAA